MNSGENRILVLLPSRGRPDNVKRFYESWKKNSAGLNDVVVLLDLDDETYNTENEYWGKINEDFVVSAVKRMNLVEKLNSGLKDWVNSYSIIGFLGDDVIIETKDWDKKIIEKFKELGKYGMLYPNDGYNKHNVPNHIFVTKQWCELFSWFAYPKLQHLYIDNLWRDIGNHINMNPKIDGKYYHAMDIVLRHEHFFFNKEVKKDSLYQEIYSKKYTGDVVKYREYVGSQEFAEILKKMEE